MSAKGRTPGQWKEVAHGRAKKERVFLHGAGLTNIPVLTETGSAAYRRLQKRKRK